MWKTTNLLLNLDTGHLLLGEVWEWIPESCSVSIWSRTSRMMPTATVFCESRNAKRPWEEIDELAVKAEVIGVQED